MVKAAGELDPEDFPRMIGGEPDGGPFEWDYSYFLMPLHNMPGHWNDNGHTFKYHKLYLDWYAACAASSSMTGALTLHNASGANTTEGMATTTTTADWGNGDAPITTAGYPVGRQIYELGWSSVGAMLPRMLAMEFSAQHPNGDADASVYGLYIETVNDKAYSGAWSPTNYRNVERIERDTAADRAYKELRAASAWMVLELANTCNNLTYEARFCWPLPLYGGP